MQRPISETFFCTIRLFTIKFMSLFLKRSKTQNCKYLKQLVLHNFENKLHYYYFLNGILKLLKQHLAFLVRRAFRTNFRYQSLIKGMN